LSYKANTDWEKSECLFRPYYFTSGVIISWQGGCTGAKTKKKWSPQVHGFEARAILTGQLYLYFSAGKKTSQNGLGK